MVKFLFFLATVLLWRSCACAYGTTTPSGATSPKGVHDIKTVVQWKQMEFGFPSEEDRRKALANGNLVPSNAIPIDVAPHYHKNGLKVFVTVPRFQGGVPYTLATVTGGSGSKGPLLQPYPSYEWHSSHGANCDLITSAFRVAITECHQMWVIDSGNIGPHSHCPPQLLLFDLQNGQLLHRYRFNSSLYSPSVSLFVTPVVSVRDPPPQGRCARATVYVADVTNHGLVVYDYQADVAWRVENKFMYPDPSFGTHTIAGESFTLMDGILGMAVDKQHLYFHPMASVSEYAVSLRVLNNHSHFLDSAEAMAGAFKVLGQRDSPCVATAMDSGGHLYCVTFNPIKLISWHVQSPYGPQGFRELPINSEELQFVSGMKVVRNPAHQEELWMLSNRYQKLAAGTQNFDEVNFRILMRPLATGPGRRRPEMDLHNMLIFSN